MKTTNYSRSRMRGKLSSTVLKTSTGGDTCAEFIQGSNRKEALRILTARVNEQAIQKKTQEYGSLRKGQLGGGGRGNKIRTYNWIESRAVDHRTGKKVRNVREVLEKGRFELLM